MMKEKEYAAEAQGEEVKESKKKKHERRDMRAMQVWKQRWVDLRRNRETEKKIGRDVV